MRGVNIHADFVMIQCTKHKNLTSLSHPLCHPAIRRGSNIVYSGPGVPPFGLHRRATICRLAMRRGSEIPLAYGSRLRRGKRHLPDKVQFTGWRINQL